MLSHISYLTYDAAYELVRNAHLIGALRPLLPVPACLPPVVDLTVSQLSHGRQSSGSSPAEAEKAGQGVSRPTSSPAWSLVTGPTSSWLVLDCAALGWTLCITRHGQDWTGLLGPPLFCLTEHNTADVINTLRNVLLVPAHSNASLRAAGQGVARHLSEKKQ